MSLSDPGSSQSDKTPNSGRVIVGLQEKGLDELDAYAGKSAWTEKTTEDYIAQVKKRAKQMASEILAKAMSDAEALKQKAVQDGYEQGMQQAQADANAQVEVMRSSLNSCLAGIESGKEHIWAGHKADLVSLVRLGVEKVLAVELESSRENSLEKLLHQALELINSKTGLTVAVSPADYELINSLLEEAKKEFPDLKGFRVQARDDVQPGGVRLENDDAMVDNTVATRLETVRQVFDQLTLDEGSL